MTDGAIGELLARLTLMDLYAPRDISSDSHAWLQINAVVQALQLVRGNPSALPKWQKDWEAEIVKSHKHRAECGAPVCGCLLCEAAER